MDLRLADKTVIITGASGGIGRVLSETFAEEGANLALLSHSRVETLRSWVGEQPWQERAVVLGGDTTRPADMEAAFDAARRRFGRIDVCVANAGLWPKEDLRLDELSEERLRATVDANLFGSVWTARAFLRSLALTGPRPDGDGAALVFIGSTAGRFGERGHSDYALSKAALHGLVRSLKNEIVALDPYGRVNLVEPGWTVTAMARDALARPGSIERIVRTMPLRQLGRARDVAAAVAFLCSPAAARHLSGEVLSVAGGMEGRVLWEPGQIDPDAIRRRVDAR
jgi:3-oxoacyl-[acyl-carrier protein] reductase